MASTQLPGWAAMLKSSRFKKGTLLVVVMGGSAALIRYMRQSKPKKDTSKSITPRRQRSERVNVDRVFFKVIQWPIFLFPSLFFSCLTGFVVASTQHYQHHCAWRG